MMKRTKINFEEELLKRGVPKAAAKRYRDIDSSKFYIRRPMGSEIWRLEVLLCIDTEPSGVRRVCLEEAYRLEDIVEALERWFCGIYGCRVNAQ